MGLWLTFLALSLGIAIVIALTVLRSKRIEHAAIHDRTPPMGRPRPPTDRSAEPTLRRAR